jgi:hypothetical protein
MRARWVSGTVVAAIALLQLPTVAQDLDTDEEVDGALARAVQASHEVPHVGRVTIVSFSDQGPQITEIDLTRGAGDLRVQRDGGWELGRADGDAFLRSTDTLLRVGGVEHLPAQLDRLRAKYEPSLGASVVLDTGMAREVHLSELATGLRRETLHVDDVTGLIVRRETYGRDGRPVRVVAYTSLDVGPRTVVLPAPDGRVVVDHRLSAGALAGLRATGFVLPDRLPRGYELIAALEVAGARVPTVHAVYGDGLYTLSVFQQRGRMARTAVRGASELVTEDGGAVWRWPGSEPRKMVWSGDGGTFTVLTDAPTDEVLTAIAGLPTDPPPSTLDRLARGMARVGRWFWPMDRSDT